jgi:hypothetical protein
MHFTSRVIRFTQQLQKRRSVASIDSTGGLLFMGVLVVFSWGAPASAQGCPNLRGHWVSGSGGGLSMDLDESDCKLSSDNLNSTIGYHHVLRGQWDAESYSFRLTVARLDPHHCWTHLYGRATVTGPASFDVVITSTEGKCGLPANFTDHGSYTRQ